MAYVLKLVVAIASGDTVIVYFLLFFVDADVPATGEQLGDVLYISRPRREG